MIDERQLPEAVQHGADAIGMKLAFSLFDSLLIVACLDDEQLGHLHRLAIGAGLAALVEVHNEAELERALRNLTPGALLPLDPSLQVSTQD